MAKYLVVASYTAEGIKGVVGKGGSARRDAVGKMIADAGGTMEAFYFGFGEADAYVLVDLPDNVSVLRADVVTGAVPAGDVICSADVLEHFAPRDIDAVVSKLVGAGPFQHHVIACYDDGHTHLSILPPAAWLAIFRKYCATAYLAAVDYRRRDPTQIVCVVSNLPVATQGSDVG